MGCPFTPQQMTHRSFAFASAAPYHQFAVIRADNNAYEPPNPSTCHVP